MMTSAHKNLLETTQWRVRQHADVVRAHDAVHPDRDTCGGIGNCLLMATEHDAEQEIIRCFEQAARKSLDLKVSA